MADPGPIPDLAETIDHLYTSSNETYDDLNQLVDAVDDARHGTKLKYQALSPVVKGYLAAFKTFDTNCQAKVRGWKGSEHEHMKEIVNLEFQKKSIEPIAKLLHDNHKRANEAVRSWAVERKAVETLFDDENAAVSKFARDLKSFVEKSNAYADLFNDKMKTLTTELERLHKAGASRLDLEETDEGQALTPLIKPAQVLINSRNAGVRAFRKAVTLKLMVLSSLNELVVDEWIRAEKLLSADDWKTATDRLQAMVDAEGEQMEQ